MNKIYLEWCLSPLAVGLMPAILHTVTWSAPAGKHLDPFVILDFMAFGFALNIYNIIKIVELRNPDISWSIRHVLANLCCLVLFIYVFFLEKTNETGQNGIVMIVISFLFLIGTIILGIAVCYDFKDRERSSEYYG